MTDTAFDRAMMGLIAIRATAVLDALHPPAIIEQVNEIIAAIKEMEFGASAPPTPEPKSTAGVTRNRKRKS